MDGRWVSAYANELGRLYFFQQTKQTTNLASISLSKLRELPIPVAPLAEQKRVWSIVESLFGEIEAGEQELLKAREGVATYRRAVLKAAVTGELTKEWRASRGDLFETGDTFLAQALKTWRPTPVNTKHPVPTRPDQKQLPRAWVWATMDQVLTDIEAGLNVKCEGRPPGPEERGLIKISAVTYGEFRELESKTLPGEAKVQEPLRIQPGDFLFSRANTIELVGAPTIVSSITRELYLSDKVLRFRFAIPIEKWAFYWLRSPWGRREIETRATGAQLSMRNITQESIRALPIPLPSEEEMQVIVGFLDLAFQEIGQLGAEIDTWCSDVSRSRQATLSAAFSGKLVPQAPNDEPASELLARLRAARAAAPAPKAPRAPRKNARSRQQVAAA
jgi:type I restriction enzyme S subunit